jgi:hypothetical protein
MSSRKLLALALLGLLFVSCWSPAKASDDYDDDEDDSKGTDEEGDGKRPISALAGLSLASLHAHTVSLNVMRRPGPAHALLLAVVVLTSANWEDKVKKSKYALVRLWIRDGSFALFCFRAPLTEPVSLCLPAG